MSLTTISLPTEAPERARGDCSWPVDESWLLGVVLGFVALVYAATLRFQFVFDDHGIIVGNPLLKSWRYAPRYFRGGGWQNFDPQASANWYRPLFLVWLRLNNALFGLHSSGWHAGTLLLHLVTTALAFWVARRLTGRPLVAAATTLLFGLHPMRHDVVAWVSGSSESLCAVFFFAAFLAYLKSRDDGRNHPSWLVAACAFYASAVLAQETAVVFPVVVFVHASIYWCPTEDPRSLLQTRLGRSVMATIAYVPVTAAYLAIRVAVLHGFQHVDTNVSIGAWALTAPSVLFFYIKQWLLPIHVWAFYDVPLRTSFDVVHVLLPALAIIALVAAFWFLRDKPVTREVYFSLAWLGILLLPVLDFAVLPKDGLVHDRYFYLPSFGAALILGLALDQLARAKGPQMWGMPRAWLLAMLALVGLLSCGAANASGYWVDDAVLFERASRVTPASPTVRLNYALELAEYGNLGGAVQSLQNLVSDRPDDWQASFNLGRLYYQIGFLQAAENYLSQSLQIYPAPRTYLQLGLVYMKANHPIEAETNLRRAVELQPEDAELRFALGAALTVWGKCDDARAQLTKALELSPGFPHAQEQMDRCAEGPEEP